SPPVAALAGSGAWTPPRDPPRAALGFRTRSTIAVAATQRPESRVPDADAGPGGSKLLLECFQGLLRTGFVRVGQLDGLFGRGDRLGLAAGGGQHVREYQVPFPLLRSAADPRPGSRLGFRPPAEPQ